jgi:hypothetical protein
LPLMWTPQLAHGMHTFKTTCLLINNSFTTETKILHLILLFKNAVLHCWLARSCLNCCVPAHKHRSVDSMWVECHRMMCCNALGFSIYDGTLTHPKVNALELSTVGNASRILTHVRTLPVL